MTRKPCTVYWVKIVPKSSGTVGYDNNKKFCIFFLVKFYIIIQLICKKTVLVIISNLYDIAECTEVNYKHDNNPK